MFSTPVRQLIGAFFHTPASSLPTYVAYREHIKKTLESSAAKEPFTREELPLYKRCVALHEDMMKLDDAQALAIRAASVNYENEMKRHELIARVHDGLSYLASLAH
jgi:hypothetical protein